MVVGFSKTNINLEKTALVCQQFEHIDFLVLMYAAQGAIQAGSPFSCSGQNLSYRRESFYTVKGFSGIEMFLSGDDLLLMQKFVQNKMNIRFANLLTAYTETNPVNSWSELINQRSRWASNLRAMAQLNPTFFVYLLSCFICMAIFPFFSIILYLIKLFFDRDFIIDSTQQYNMEHLLTIKKPNVESPFWYEMYKFFVKHRLSYFMLWYIITPFYVWVVTWRGLFRKFEWKGVR
jgi:cellulose synthase/poly-beta-1,6-N-acetylglucosamine synthase-like glycosyltransferase